MLKKNILKHYTQPIIYKKYIYILHNKKHIKYNQIPTTQKPLIFNIIIPLSKTPPTPYKINTQKNFIQLYSLSH